MLDLLECGVGTLRAGIGCLCCAVCTAVIFVIVGAVMLVAPNTRAEDIDRFNAAASQYNATDLPRMLATSGDVTAGAVWSSGNASNLATDLVPVEVKGNRDGVTPDVEAVVLRTPVGSPGVRIVETSVDVLLTTRLGSGTSSGTITIPRIPMSSRRFQPRCPSNHSSSTCTSSYMETICRQSSDCAQFYPSSGSACRRGAYCGECYVPQQVSHLCRTLRWRAVASAGVWVLTGDSCSYDDATDSWRDPTRCPGWSSGTLRYDAPLPVALHLRADSDPWIDLMDITHGSANFGLTEAEQRAIGLALLIVGILMVAAFGCAIAAIVKALGSNGRGQAQQRIMYGAPYQPPMQHQQQQQPMLQHPGEQQFPPPPHMQPPPANPYQQQQQQQHQPPPPPQYTPPVLAPGGGYPQQQQQYGGGTYNPTPMANTAMPAPIGGAGGDPNQHRAGMAQQPYPTAAYGSAPVTGGEQQGSRSIGGGGAEEGAWVTSGGDSATSKKPKDPFEALGPVPADAPAKPGMLLRRGSGFELAPEPKRDASPSPPADNGPGVTETHADFFKKRELPPTAAAASPSPMVNEQAAERLGPDVTETHADFFRRREIAAAEQAAPGKPAARGSPGPRRSSPPRRHDDSIGALSPVQAAASTSAAPSSIIAALDASSARKPAEASPPANASLSSPPMVAATPPPPTRRDGASPEGALQLPPPTVTAPPAAVPIAAAAAPVGRTRSDTAVFAVPAEKKVNTDARLIHVFGSIRETRQEEVPLALSSLDENDAFILDTPDTIWVFQGSACSPGERAASARLAGELEAARPQAELAVTNTAEAPEAFWRWFGGRGPIKK